MRDQASIQLTLGNRAVLETLLGRCLGRNDPMAALLRRKLENATVVSHDDLHPRVVTLNSRVTYRIGERPSDTRILVSGEMRHMVGMTLPVTTRRGLAMLGLRQGDSVMIELGDGTAEILHVEAVVYQPEAASRRYPAAGKKAGGSKSGTRPFLRLVFADNASGNRVAYKFPAPDPEFDGPGPSAA